jgi:hypothetical protein
VAFDAAQATLSLSKGARQNITQGHRHAVALRVFAASW